MLDFYRGRRYWARDTVSGRMIQVMPIGKDTDGSRIFHKVDAATIGRSNYEAIIEGRAFSRVQFQDGEFTVSAASVVDERSSVHLDEVL